MPRATLCQRMPHRSTTRREAPAAPSDAGRQAPAPMIDCSALKVYPSAPRCHDVTDTRQQLRDELPHFLNVSFEAASDPIAAASQLRRDLHVCRQVQQHDHDHRA
jgi:hypothetical protein